MRAWCYGLCCVALCGSLVGFVEPAILVSHPLWAQQPVPPTPPADPPVADPVEETEALVRKQLLKRVSLDFAETPLHDVVVSLAEQLIVQIVVDEKRLEDAGVARDAPITFQLRNVTGKSALRLMLEKYDLGYTIRDEVLWITTREMAESDQATRVYNVRDVLAELSQGASAPPLGGAAGKSAPPVSAAALVELIQANVEPDTWTTAGGVGNVHELNGLLVVSSNERVHAKIETLLQLLREASGKPGTVAKPK